MARLSFSLGPSYKGDGMTNPKQDDNYSEAETEARREAALQRMFVTPRKPHEASGKRRKESSQSK